MVEIRRTELKVRAERAVLVGAIDSAAKYRTEQPLYELQSLARTAGAVVAGQMVQHRRRPHRTHYIGAGKVAELKRLCAQTEADLVICDDDLAPAQVRTLESVLDLKVVDRSEVIMDIFACHARTRDAKLQVELAQLEYAFPRLKRMWTHLDRTAGGTLGGPAGGGIGVRGPGERQLEMDRRLVQRRIHDLKKRIQGVQKRRRVMVESRKQRFTTVALVGYTNAGKSSLMNALSGARVSVRDRLFETLETRTRQWKLPDGREVLLSDTVGFIRKLPHHLVASFRATLEEAVEADLLLHIIDAASGDLAGQVRAVQEVLAEIRCDSKPVVNVLNKVDVLADASELPLIRSELDGLICTSALTGEGLDALSCAVTKFLDEGQGDVTVRADVGNGRLLTYLHENALVLGERYEGQVAELRVRVPHGMAGVIERLGGQVRSSSSFEGAKDETMPM